MSGSLGFRRALAVVIVALVTGCASASGKPLTSVQPIVGKWNGTIAVGHGPPQFYYLTINPDGTIVATWGANWQWGRIMLNRLQARFELDHITSGQLLYYDGPSGRAIQMTPDFGGWYVYVTPVK